MPDLRRVKVGDEVYVVPQNNSSVGYYRTISRVGRRYGYVEMNHYQTEEPFDLATGESHHDPNHNARANRYGFDVYHSREEYLEHVSKTESVSRLCRRLAPRNSYAVEAASMSTELVAELHAVLDRHGFNVIAQQMSMGD
jgi:hypothetical protein